MPQQLIHNDSVLRRVLARWAARFTPDEHIQGRLVENTILEILRRFPEADDDCTIDVQLLATMRQVLLREFGVHPAAANKGSSEESCSD